MLDGGTKRRAFTVYVKSKPEIDEFVYAHRDKDMLNCLWLFACKDLGKKCTVTIPQGERYWLSDAAEELGANIIEVPMGYLTNIQSKAKKYCFDNGAHLIPFGGDHPVIIEAMRQTALSLDVNPTEVWTVMSSGVLSRGLQAAWPDAKVYGVRIGHNTTRREQGRAETYKSKYEFHQECKEPERPPFQSSLTYDSKAWTFIQKHATKGALFWNVGK